MNRNRFLMLVAVTLAAAVLVVVLDRPGNSAAEDMPATLLPGLEDAVNALSAVDILAPGGAIAVSLRRDDDRWRVAQRDGYEADFAEVLEMLRTLAEVGVAEPKTSNPDWYSHLGVQDLSDPDATGRRIDFPGREVASLIIGQVDPSGEGSYARRADQAQSWLLDAVIGVPVDPVAWLEPGIMDIGSADIAQVVIRHADGEVIRLDRAGEEGPAFVLRDVPEGREAGGEWRRNAIANGLRALNLEDVRRFEPPVPEDATRVLFTTTDGLNFVAELFELDENYWVHFTVSAENAVAPEAPSDGDESDAADPANPAGDVDADTDNDSEADADADAENQRLVNAVAVDARLSPWMFAIPERRYNDLTQRMEDLLEPIEVEDES